MNKFNNNIVLEIYRKYGKDESIAYLKSLITPLQEEIGILKSELEEEIAKRKEANRNRDEIAILNKKLKENSLYLQKTLEETI